MGDEPLEDRQPLQPAGILLTYTVTAFQISLVEWTESRLHRDPAPG